MRSGPSFRHLPIRVRLTIAFAGVLTVVLAASGVVLYTEFARDLDSVIDQDLESRAADVSALLSGSSDPRETLAVSGEAVAQVYTVDGRLLASTRRARRGHMLSVGETRRADRGPVRIDRADTALGDVRVQAMPARTADGTQVVLAVGEPLSRRDRPLDRLRDLLLIAAPLALLLAIYAGYQVAGAALRPVERMRVRAEQITDRDTAQRLPVPASHDEIEALGRTLNALLTRLDSALARERRLLSDASHELRTPLAVLRTEVQLALRGERDPSELRAALESAGQEAERLSRLADDLLEAAARRAGAAASAAGRRVVPEVDSDGTPVALADPDRTAQALDNLVANALAHGRGEVRLTARAAHDRVELHVTDKGPGFPEQLLERAFERFSRGDPARAGEGTGLGLAIVAAIAQAHGGEVGARNPPGGGADVWISLPAA